jgi:hypothetical protein
MTHHSFDTSLELGFGRPAMSSAEPYEHGFLQLIETLPPSHEGISSGLYLAGLSLMSKVSNVSYPV